MWSDWRNLDRKKIKWLKSIFKKSECNWLNFQNYISINIDKKELKIAVEQLSNIQQKTLLNKNVTLVKFVFSTGYRLIYFHNFYQILVGRKFFWPWNKWWIVKLFNINKIINKNIWITVNCIFLLDISDKFKTHVNEQYFNETKLSAGEIYCKIQQYQTKKFFELKLKW